MNPDRQEAPYTSSLRPSARGSTNYSPSAQLKDRLVEEIEKVIGKPLLPSNPVVPTQVDHSWQMLSVLDSKWEKQYEYTWNLPSDYDWPTSKISKCGKEEIEDCNALLDLGVLYPSKTKPARGLLSRSSLNSQKVQPTTSNKDKPATTSAKISTNAVFDEMENKSSQLRKLAEELMKLSTESKERNKTLQEKYARNLGKKDEKIASLESAAEEHTKAKKVTEAAELRYQDELEKLRIQLSEQVKENQRYKNLLDVQDDQLEDTTKKLEDALAEVSAWSQQIDHLESEISRLKQLTHVHEERRELFPNGPSDGRLQHANPNEQVSHLRDENARLTAEVKEITEKKNYFEHELNSSRLEVKALNDRIARLRSQVSQLKNPVKIGANPSTKRPLEEPSSTSASPSKKFSQVPAVAHRPTPSKASIETKANGPNVDNRKVK